MTSEQLFENECVEIDDALASAIEDGIDLMISRGASDDQVREFFARYHRDLMEWRAKMVRDVRAWIDRGGECLH